MSKSTGAAAADAGNAAGKPKGSLVSILIAVVLSTVIALGVAGGAVAWLLKSGKLGSAPATAAAGKPDAAGNTPDAAAGKSGEELPPSHLVALEPMVVNLADPGARSYLRASISLRVADPAAAKGAPKEKEGKEKDKGDSGASAALRDTTLTVLGAQSSEHLLAPGGLDGLKKKLRESYALENRETHVLDVYVTDFLVQRG